MPAKRTYRARPIKQKKPRKRRTKKEIQAIRSAIYEAIAADHPSTVRHVFYVLAVNGIVPKTEAECKNTVGRLVLKMRREGIIPYDWITDSTRWMRKPDSYSDLKEALLSTARHYRRAFWNEQPAYVEIWAEKDAIAGILVEETAKWDVPLMVARGFASETFLYEAAELIKAKGKPTYLYHFGDYDPSGIAAARDIERRLRGFAPDAEIHFERAAVTLEQIKAWDLPTRPTKKTDSRSKNFKGESVEIDAISPRLLRELVSKCITQHIDRFAFNRIQDVEEAERDTLQTIIEDFVV